MALSDSAIFRKTDKGQHELKTRAFGLSPRTRQVLILIDGRRSAGELARMIPEHELLACLTLLDGEGFVEAAIDPAAGTGGFAVAAASSAASAPVTRYEALPAIRQRAVRTLLDTVGPHGEEIAVALERCSSADELRSLIAAAASVVEAVLGREASARFVARIGLD